MDKTPITKLAKAMSTNEFCLRLRDRCLRNLIAASAADADGETEQANRYRFAARMFSAWAEDLLAARA
jgi:hypothetical protein